MIRIESDESIEDAVEALKGFFGLEEGWIAIVL
jgi:hypothetical protein